MTRRICADRTKQHMRHLITTIRKWPCAIRRQFRAPFFVSLIILLVGTEITSAREHADPLEQRALLLARYSRSCGPAGPRLSVVEPPRPAFAVMPFQRLQEEQPAWMGDALRYLVSARLKVLGGNDIVLLSPDAIDRERAGRDDLTTARQLGVRKYITGKWFTTGKKVQVITWVVDVETGEQEDADSVTVDPEEPRQLETELVPRMLQRLQVGISAEQIERAASGAPTNTSASALGLLLEAEGISTDSDGGAPEQRPTHGITPRPTAQLHLDLRDWLSVTTASAQEVTADATASVRTFLEDYRLAHEREDLEGLAKLYTVFTDRQRTALASYFQFATDLKVELVDITITVSEDSADVVYTRRDRFTDTRNGQAQRLEVPLSRKLVRTDGVWKFAGN